MAWGVAACSNDRTYGPDGDGADNELDDNDSDDFEDDDDDDVGGDDDDDDDDNDDTDMGATPCINAAVSLCCFVCLSVLLSSSLILAVRSPSRRWVTVIFHSRIVFIRLTRVSA